MAPAHTPIPAGKRVGGLCTFALREARGSGERALACDWRTNKVGSALASTLSTLDIMRSRAVGVRLRPHMFHSLRSVTRLGAYHMRVIRRRSTCVGTRGQFGGLAALHVLPPRPPLATTRGGLTQRLVMLTNRWLCSLVYGDRGHYTAASYLRAGR